MYEHHKESIEKMIEHYRENPEIVALFLVGSVATETAREDSDIDGVAIVAKEIVDRKRQNEGTEECVHGKCTYPAGYFNIHYMSKEDLIRLGESGSEPMRNLFNCFQTLYSDDPELPKLAEKIPIFQDEEADRKKFKFYCTMKQFHRYFWLSCKPEGFMRFHVADGIIFNLYRLILSENRILFPSMRKLEESVINAPKKPDKIVELCHRFMKSLSDEDCQAIIDGYENWTTYEYTKKSSDIMNNFADQWEWQ
ncbi:MAG: nucleotidyltransferase domain-containing protein [Clostridiales bacterium]|nr:nucleotidyltransferase domain-containing protein [Clostridiales bacterium]